MVDRPKFECAPGLRLQAHERLSEVHNRNIEQRLERLQAVMEKLEMRLWIVIYGMIAVILTQGLREIISVAPALAQ
jgi:hypothetical protein